MKNIYLIGFMGAGKSTAAKELETRIGGKRIEMDQLIEEQQQKPITQIFEEFGETYFRDLETGLLRSFAGEENLVVSCGGGCVLRGENVKIMKENGKIVFLAAAPETIYARVKDSTNRPILNGNMNVEYIRGLMENRRECYETAADMKIDTDGKTLGQICDEILSDISMENE